MPLREPLILRETDHGVIAQEYTNKGRALSKLEEWNTRRYTTYVLPKPQYHRVFIVIMNYSDGRERLYH